LFTIHPTENNLQKHCALGYYEEEIMDEAHDISEQAALIPMNDGDKVLCVKCNKILGSMHSAKRHYNISHQQNIKARCQICGKVYKNQNSRQVHMIQTHGVTAKMMKNAIPMPQNPQQ